MTQVSSTLFSFDEPDHLTRIHLKLALQDMGFQIEEDEERLRLLSGDGGQSSRSQQPEPCGAF